MDAGVFDSNGCTQLSAPIPNETYTSVLIGFRNSRNSKMPQALRCVRPQAVMRQDEARWVNISYRKLDWTFLNYRSPWLREVRRRSSEDSGEYKRVRASWTNICIMNCIPPQKHNNSIKIVILPGCAVSFEKVSRSSQFGRYFLEMRNEKGYNKMYQKRSSISAEWLKHDKFSNLSRAEPEASPCPSTLSSARKRNRARRAWRRTYSTTACVGSNEWFQRWSWYFHSPYSGDSLIQSVNWVQIEVMS